MLKRFVSAVVGVTCIAATIGVSAASPSVSTTTTYKVGDTSKISVTSSVSGVATDDILTYLAYDKDVTSVIEGSQIVYIDQKKADGTSVTFSYDTASTDIEAKVKVGGKQSNGTAFTAVEGTIPAADYVVNVKVNNGDSTSKTLTGYTTATDDDYICIDSVVTDGQVVSAVAVGETSVEDFFVGNGGLYIKKSAITNGCTISVTTEAAATPSELKTSGAGMTVETSTGSTSPVKSIIAMGKVLGLPTEYGVEISTDGGTTWTAYAALGKGTDGVYAVKLEGFNEVSGWGDVTTVYVRAYYGSDDNKIYGDTYTIAVSGSENIAGSKQSAE